MRLWTLHPMYLDSKGLVALWREGLLAQHVLLGKTKGYTKHPQLIRFSQHPSPVDAITAYLHFVADEADARGFHFDRTKLSSRMEVQKIQVSAGQVDYETLHLKKKLEIRDKKLLVSVSQIKKLETHPLFEVIPGPIEAWEILEKSTF